MLLEVLIAPVKGKNRDGGVSGNTTKVAQLLTNRCRAQSYTAELNELSRGFFG